MAPPLDAQTPVAPAPDPNMPDADGTARLTFPPKLCRLAGTPRGAVMYRGAHGGRGSAKSMSFALLAAAMGFTEKLRILVTREFHTSIKDSFHAEVKAAIAKYPWLEAGYDVGVDYIRSHTGTEFIFKGLRHNVGGIKSLAKIDITIVEEAEDVSEESWIALEATVLREPQSELWGIWNPSKRGSPVDKRFRQSPSADAIIVEMNYRDNNFFPAGLEKLRLRQQDMFDPNTYAHVWEGAYLEKSAAQIFAGKYEAKEFDPQSTWGGPYHGIDFGFSQDPTTGVECYVHDDCLYIRREAGKVGLDLDDTTDFLTRKLPYIATHVIRADSARPESISFLKRHGLPKIEGVKKGAGSVEDGVEFIKAFKRIYIHPECVQTLREFLLYAYTIDKRSGDVLTSIVDANNHFIDAIRYALKPLMTGAKKAGMLLSRRN